MQRRLLSSTCRHVGDADFTHGVIGAGVVGLAVARALAVRNPATLLLERHASIGTETSSRSSEVVHAGLYYGPGTLKTSLCVAGREELYAYCADRGVAHRRLGKWIVAQTSVQRDALQRLHDFATNHLGHAAVPVRWVDAAEAQRREPAVRADAGVLESPSTGIVDSHGLMVALAGDFEHAGGTLALASAVDAVRPLNGLGGRRPGDGGWELTVRHVASGETSTVVVETLVNSAGLGAVDVHNMIVPPERRKKLFCAKGNYFSYAGSSPRVGTLVYPVPEPGHAGLGTHLTLDLAGRMRFGPDSEWVESPHDLAVNASRLAETVQEVKKYLPAIDESMLQPDYAGIRPKLARGATNVHQDGNAFADFIIRKEDGYEGWVNLLGIESPGLTSSLAIGDMVKRLLYTT